MLDDRDFITRSISLSETTNGVKPSPEELAATLVLHSRDKRGLILDQIKADLQHKQHTAREAAEFMRYERALRLAHEKALAVGK